MRISLETGPGMSIHGQHSLLLLHGGVGNGDVVMYLVKQGNVEIECSSLKTRRGK